MLKATRYSRHLQNMTIREDNIEALEHFIYLEYNSISLYDIIKATDIHRDMKNRIYENTIGTMLWKQHLDTRSKKL